MAAQFGRLRRQILRVVTASSLSVAAATAGVIVPAAASASDVPLGKYAVSIDFADKFVQAGSAHSFDLTFTNVSGTTNYLLEKATADFGFAVTSATATDGWTTAIDGDTVTIQPGLLVNGLLDGQSVGVRVTATAPASAVGIATHQVATTASGVVGLTGLATDFDNAGSDPSFIVATYATADSCNAGEDCDTGLIGDPSDTQARAVSAASGSADVVGITVGSPEGPCGGLIQANGKSKAVTVDSVATDRVVTVTMRLDKSKVNETSPNGVGNSAVCHEAAPGKTFTDRNGNTVAAGFLAKCSATAPAPCLAALTKNAAGDFLATVKQPGGDPKSIMGYPIPGT